MANTESKRKEVEALSTDEARDSLGPLILRAGFGNERIPIKYHGELRAWLIGLDDMQRLQAMDAA